MRCTTHIGGLGLLLVLLITTSSPAQLTPDKLYYGIDRAIPMTVERPDGTEGALSIKLLAASDASVVASQEVPEGAVDLSGLFPRLWTSSTPELLHAQLFAGEAKVGPSVVLQPGADEGVHGLQHGQVLLHALVPRAAEGEVSVAVRDGESRGAARLVGQPR